jgi:hypothetical protein
MSECTHAQRELECEDGMRAGKPGCGSCRPCLRAQRDASRARVRELESEMQARLVASQETIGEFLAARQRIRELESERDSANKREHAAWTEAHRLGDTLSAERDGLADRLAVARKALEAAETLIAEAAPLVWAVRGDRDGASMWEECAVNVLAGIRAALGTSVSPRLDPGPSQDFIDGQCGALHNAAMIAYDMGRPDIRHAINRLLPESQRPIDTPSIPTGAATPTERSVPCAVGQHPLCGWQPCACDCHHGGAPTGTAGTPCKAWCGTNDPARAFGKCWHAPADQNDYCSKACADARRPLNPPTPSEGR